MIKRERECVRGKKRNKERWGKIEGRQEHKESVRRRVRDRKSKKEIVGKRGEKR